MQKANKIQNSLNLLKLKLSHTVHFHSSNHQQWLPNQILGSKTEKKNQIDPQTKEITSKKLNVHE